MRTKQLFMAALIAGALAARPAAAAPALAGPPPLNAYIFFGGIDWAWASPCNNDCSTITLAFGFRYPTTAEWAVRPVYGDFIDPLGNAVGAQNGIGIRCASAYFDNTHSHCDDRDFRNNRVAGGPGNGPPPGRNQETLIVRDSAIVPEPSSVVMVAAGLLGLLGVSRRRKPR